MSEDFQPGQHPDADQLNALAEGALPVHEREATLAHLAGCAHCRMIVSLALPPMEDEAAAPQPVFTARKPWFANWSFLWPTAAAGFAALLVFVVHMHNMASRNAATTPPLTATVTPAPQPLPTGAATPPAEPQAAAPPAAKAPPVSPSTRSVAPPTPLVTGAQVAGAQVAGGLGLPRPVRRDTPAPGGTVSDIIDSQGIAGQEIENLPVNSRNVANLRQDEGRNAALGQLRGAAQGSAAAASPAGTPAAPAYALNAPAPVLSAPMPAAPVPPATAPASAVAKPAPPKPFSDSSAGGVVARESAKSSVVALKVNALPSHLPIASSILHGAQTLALDSAGALFLSTDGGHEWKAVSTPWSGRAVQITLASYSHSTWGGTVINGQNVGGGPPSSDARAASASASMSGMVTDATGAAIPGTAIVLSDEHHSVVRRGKTDKTGHYLLDGLAPGAYTLTADAAGFTSSETASTLLPRQAAALNFKLNVGAQSETVTVEASPLQTDTAAAVPRSTQSDVSTSVARKRAPAKTTPTTPPIFAVTTDSGDRWTSADGLSWSRN